MICKNCGAHFDDNLPKCPYCNAFHYEGANKEYMDKLEDMKEDLEDLQETVPEIYTSELKSQAKQVRKITLIILGILVLLALLLWGGSFLMDSLFKYDAKAELLFAKEAYPVADEYYAAGDYEELIKFYHTSMEENENANFYNWEHYPFLMCYENFDCFMHAASLIGTEDFSDFYMIDLFYCYISNRYYQKGYPMDEHDLQLVVSYEEEMEAVINSLGLTEEERKEFNDLLNGAEYPSWNEIKSFSKKIYTRIY